MFLIRLKNLYFSRSHAIGQSKPEVDWLDQQQEKTQNEIGLCTLINQGTKEK